MPEEV